jgi:pyruvate/2-oxoglutarate dehydrogenase complex dihydrolipoamide acyltransferase (E2) component
VNDFVLKASAEALRRVPQVNGSWEGSQIRYFGAAHVSFAVAIDDGLITPVIRDAHQKSVFQISAEAKSLGKQAKEKKLKPEQFTGGTFCVSNLGMMGIPRFSAIINPPNAAILAVGSHGQETRGKRRCDRGRADDDAHAVVRSPRRWMVRSEHSTSERSRACSKRPPSC